MSLFPLAEVRCLAHVRGANAEAVPPPMRHGLDSELRAIKERAVKIALPGTVRSIKAGLIPLLEGRTAISALAWPVKYEGPLEESLRIFEGVAGEIEDLPAGAVRKLWPAAALAEKGAEMAEFEKRVRPAVIDGGDQLEAALLAELKS